MAARRVRGLVTVAIPVLNEEAHIGEQLAPLAGQTYRGSWEVLVVDNGCSDRTVEIVRSFASLASLRVADATRRRGINRARNVAAAEARGDLLAASWAGTTTLAVGSTSVPYPVCAVGRARISIRKLLRPQPPGLPAWPQCFAGIPCTTT